MFEAHGSYRLELFDDVLVLSAVGAWNSQLAREFVDALQSFESQLPERWAHVVLLEDWELLTSDAEELIYPTLKWVEDKGLCHTAHVYSFSPLKRYLLERMIPSGERSHSKQDFPSIQLACDWLVEQGYQSAGEIPQQLVDIPAFTRHLRKQA
ncbi:hypothetical protein [Aliagarivorans taiwanensis]|uniref:hypothetical protein n=1 Tax=Aliagarivorans taiwanensis TaxID=561966 RepID=UPI0003FB279D|nr:hypothetical protein [Aliagarivorans taiwanensis]